MRQKDKTQMDGWVTITVAEPKGELASRLQQQIVEATGSAQRELIKKFNTMFGVRQYRFHNIVPTVGRSRIASALAGFIADEDDIKVNYSALGTGTTAPANGNTQLETETFRKLIASISTSNNIFYGTAFYLAGDTNGTFFEHGIFINGSASANSGIILSRVLLNAPTGITKSATETLTIEHSIELI